VSKISLAPDVMLVSLSQQHMECLSAVEVVIVTGVLALMDCGDCFMRRYHDEGDHCSEPVKFSNFCIAVLENAISFRLVTLRVETSDIQ